MTKPTFTVDENSDPKAAQQVLLDLKRMIRLGSMAQKAVEGLERDGFYDGVVPVVDHSQEVCNRTERQYWKDTDGKKTSQLYYVHLPKRQSISRADLGDLSQFRAELVGKSNEMQLWITGPVAVQTVSRIPVYEIQEHRFKLGHVRINKHHISWLSPSGFGTGAIFRLYQNTKYDGAKVSLEAFARRLSKELAVENTNSHKVIREGQEDQDDEEDQTVKVAAKTLDLQDSAWEWLLEDGHAERLVREIHDLVKVHDVMNR